MDRTVFFPIFAAVLPKTEDMKRTVLSFFIITITTAVAFAQQVETAATTISPRSTCRLDKGWKFAFGNAADPKKDFGCGTEYFNYLTKATKTASA